MQVGDNGMNINFWKVTILFQSEACYYMCFMIIKTISKDHFSFRSIALVMIFWKEWVPWRLNFLRILVFCAKSDSGKMGTFVFIGSVYKTTRFLVQHQPRLGRQEGDVAVICWTLVAITWVPSYTESQFWVYVPALRLGVLEIKKGFSWCATHLATQLSPCLGWQRWCLAPRLMVLGDFSVYVKAGTNTTELL